MNLSVLAMWMPGPFEWAAIVVVALLVFGKRLPDVARSVGKSIVEFKKGIRDVQSDVDVQSRIEPPASSKLERKPETTDEASATSESREESSARPE